MSKKAIEPQSAQTKRIIQLAGLVLEAAAVNTHMSDLAERLEVSAIALYKWLNGAPISPTYALWLAYHLRDQVGTMTNKRKRDQAQRLVDELFPGTRQKKVARSTAPRKGLRPLQCVQCDNKAVFDTPAELAAHAKAVHGFASLAERVEGIAS